MLSNYMNILLLLGLSGFALAKDPFDKLREYRQKGVQPGALREYENQRVQRQCGIVSPKSSGSQFYIFKGKNMTQEELLKEAPWVVSINYVAVNPSDTKAMLCSGVLISPRHVLTAAHCQTFNDSFGNTCDNEEYRHKINFEKREVARYRIRVGTICGHRDCPEQGKTYHVKRIIFPHSFTDGAHASQSTCKPFHGDTETDIAIHELTEDVEGAQFPCLAHKARKNEPMSNYGYGLSMENQERHFLKKHTLNYNSCKRWWQQRFMYTANGVECLLHTQPNASLACLGDSGGPVVSDVDGRTYSVGILTAGDSCPNAKFEADRNNGSFTTIGDMMTSVPHYLNWICKWSGVCPPQADATKDQRPTNIWHRNDAHRDSL